MSNTATAPKRFPFWKKRYRYQAADDPQRGHNFWRRETAENGMLQIAAYINRLNQEDALLGMNNYAAQWELIDRATGEVLSAAEAKAWNPVAPAKAHQNLVRRLGLA